MNLDAERIALITQAADLLDLEEVRYTQRFDGDCPNGPRDSDGLPARLEDGSIIQHGDNECELCDGTGTVEDENAPWLDPLIEGLRALAGDLLQYTPQPRMLPPYSGENAVCPKCGNSGATDDGIHTHFGYTPRPDQLAPTGVFLVFGEHGPTAAPGPKQSLPPWLEGMVPEQEFLARGCGRCGFLWVEACMDDPGLALARLGGVE